MEHQNLLSSSASSFMDPSMGLLASIRGMNAGKMTGHPTLASLVSSRIPPPRPQLLESLSSCGSVRQSTKRDSLIESMLVAELMATESAYQECRMVEKALRDRLLLRAASARRRAQQEQQVPSAAPHHSLYYHRMMKNLAERRNRLCLKDNDDAVALKGGNPWTRRASLVHSSSTLPVFTDILCSNSSNADTQLNNEDDIKSRDFKQHDENTSQPSKSKPLPPLEVTTSLEQMDTAQSQTMRSSPTSCRVNADAKSTASKGPPVGPTSTSSLSITTALKSAIAVQEQNLKRLQQQLDEQKVLPIVTEEAPRRRREICRAPAISFPSKLFHMLEEAEDEKYDDIISFLPDGEAFIIHQPEVFTKTVLPKYFKTCRISSFQKQLSLYGFRRLQNPPNLSHTSSCMVYGHRFFQRDDKKLVAKIIRKKQCVPTGEPMIQAWERCGLLS